MYKLQDNVVYCMRAFHFVYVFDYIYLCMYCTAFQDGMRWDAINVTTFCNQHKQVRTENMFCPCI